MKEKVIDCVCVIAALVLAVYAARNVGLEYLLRGTEPPITLAMAEETYAAAVTGLPAAEDIPRIQDQEQWEELWKTSCVTIEPTDIIATGIGERHPWVEEYQRSTTRRVRSRTVPLVGDMRWDLLDEYAEYYLLQLPDGSYILAQIALEDAKKLQIGKAVTLPVGSKTTVPSQAQGALAEVCAEYGVSTEYAFYSINDEWNEAHEFMMLIIRFLLGAVVCVVIGIGLITIIYKIFKIK